eukprot:2346202-Rhodomonas_salina.2
MVVRQLRPFSRTPRPGLWQSVVPHAAKSNTGKQDKASQQPIATPIYVALFLGEARTGPIGWRTQQSAAHVCLRQAERPSPPPRTLLQRDCWPGPVNGCRNIHTHISA